MARVTVAVLAARLLMSASAFAADEPGPPPPPQIDQVDAADVDWSRLRAIEPGTPLVVTVAGEPERGWRFRRSDAAQVIVANRVGREQTIMRRDVTEIKQTERQGSKLGAIGFAVVGTLVGAYIALDLGLTVRCQPACGGVETMMGLSAVGIPVAAGILGYHVFGHSTERILYRAP